MDTYITCHTPKVAYLGNVTPEISLYIWQVNINCNIYNYVIYND
jgi:hypothetical protein